MGLLNEVISDARFGVRSLYRARGLAFIAISTLVVGIGAVTTAFSLINSAYFKELPYPGSERIVALTLDDPERPSGTFSAVPWILIEVLRHGNLPFERIAAFRQTRLPGRIGREPLQVSVVQVDTGFADLLSARPLLGRWLSRDELVNGLPSLVIDEGLWRSRLGEDTEVLSRVIDIEGRPYQVVGVMGREFAFPSRTQVWLPFPAITGPRPDQEVDVSVLAKLRAGTNRQLARSALRAFSRQLDPGSQSRVRHSFVLQDEMLDRGLGATGRVAGLFVASTIIVLLLTCSNVGNLLLVRAGTRRNEMAVRASLGAGRWRLIRQMLVEGLILTGIAGVLGVLASICGTRLVVALVPADTLPSWVRLGLDLRVAFVACFTTLGASLLVSLIPARIGSRVDLVSAIKAGGGTGSRGGDIGRIGRRGLVVQLSLAVMLFTGAVLILKSYRRMATLDVGYSAEQVVAFQPAFGDERYRDLSARMRLSEIAASRLESSPMAAGAAVRGTLRGFREIGPEYEANRELVLRADDRVFLDGDTSRTVGRSLYPAPRWFVISGSYFALMQLQILRGRGFVSTDQIGSTRVAIVSQRLAEIAWPNADPIGRLIQRGALEGPMTVIGVIENVRDLQSGGRGFSAVPRPDIYSSDGQALSDSPEVVARTQGSQRALINAGVSAFRELDPTLPLLRAEPLAASIERSLVVLRVVGAFFGLLALVALILSVIGVYGVVAYGVSQRTREIGIRIALGGTTAEVVAMIIRDSMRFALLGVAIGAGVSLFLGRPMRAFLFDSSPLDPVLLTGVSAGFAAVALLACYLPARRAARVDPMEALRVE